MIHIIIILTLISSILPCQACCKYANCTTCASVLYIYKSSGQCLLCHHLCLQCNNSSTCLKCASSYYKKDDLCLKCPSNCEKCTQTQCQQCVPGAYKNTNGICQICEQSYVLTCLSSFRIQKCLPGYFVADRSCDPCRQNCISCNTRRTCDECKQGYLLTKGAGDYCKRCEVQNCGDCSKGQDICQKCLNNYYLNSSKNCTQMNLPNCKQFSINHCQICDQDYFLINSTCRSRNGTLKSILCGQGASGNRNYQCNGECAEYAYNPIKEVGQICLAKAEVEGGKAFQYYYDMEIKDDSFSNNRLQSYNKDNLKIKYIKSDINNKIIFKKIFPSYYKIIYKFKLFNLNYNLNIQVKFIDNSTSSLNDSSEYTLSSNQYQQIQINGSTKFIREHQVTMEIYGNSSFGISEMLLQMRICHIDCRICTNSFYCQICKKPLKLKNYQCAQSCDSLLEQSDSNGNIKCVTQCESGFFANITLQSSGRSRKQCSRCQSPCLNCLNSQTLCTQCIKGISNSTYLQQNNSCVQQCPATMFNELGKCRKCYTPCKTCSNATACLSCEIGFLNLNNKCQPYCPQNQFSNDKTKTCDDCDVICKKCQGSSTSCTQCNQTTVKYYWLNNKCYEECPASYYKKQKGNEQNMTQQEKSQNFQKCARCDSKCATCDKQGRQFCKSCLFNNLQKKSGEQYGECVQNCPIFFYAYKRVCERCKNPCDDCISQTQCKTCNTTSSNPILYLSSCINSGNCTQNNKFYIKTQNRNVSQINQDGSISTVQKQIQICTLCQSPCATCQNKTKCLSCAVGFMYQQQCQYICPEGFGNITTRICDPCPQQCSKCSSKNVCSSCRQDRVLQGVQCKESCNQGFFNQASICTRCDIQCYNCSSQASSCLSCASGYVLFEKNQVISCLITCQSGYYQSQRRCVKCQKECQACDNKQTCTKCSIGYYLNGTNCNKTCNENQYPQNTSRLCVDCTNPCVTCKNSTACKSCRANQFLSVTQTCQACSPIGYFVGKNKDGNTACIKCNQSCYTCKSSEQCNNCNAGFFLLDKQCINQSKCKQQQGRYPNTQQKACSKCNPPCKTCTDQLNCLSCQSGFFVESQKRCKTQCPRGQYSKDQKCQNCNKQNVSGCKNCYFDQNRQVCESCVESKKFYQGSCADQCPDTTFETDDLVGICQNCRSPCRTCDKNGSKCKTCSYGYLFNNSCLSNCPARHIYKQQDGINKCVQCDDSCEDCATVETNCIECKDNFLKQGKCVQSGDCGQTQYADIRTHRCTLCLDPCLRCENITYCNQCISKQQFLSNGYCQSYCPLGQFLIQGNEDTPTTCQKCHQKCKSCNGSQQKDCTQCKQKDKFIFKQKCDRCPQGFYGDSNTKSCVHCQLPCGNCTNLPTQCTTCKDHNTHLLVIDSCLQTQECPEGTYLNEGLPKWKCSLFCKSPYFSDPVLSQCRQRCSQNYIQFQTGRACVRQCPQGFYANFSTLNTVKCFQCKDSFHKCGNLLKFTSYFKSKFNVFFIQIRINQQIQLAKELSIKNFNISMIRFQLAENRILQAIETPVPILQNKLPPVIQLRMQLPQTIQNVQMKTQILGIFTVINSKQDHGLLQNAYFSSEIFRWDFYTEQQIEQGKQLEYFSMAMSLIMVIIILINLIFNNVYLSYPLLQFFQLIYMINFVDVEFPPNLNYYMYGFRYSHYLFLPQIFSKDDQLQAAPGKFGVVTQDVNFLRNTGHSFLIFFIALTLAFIIFLIQKIFTYLSYRPKKVVPEQKINQQGRQGMQRQVKQGMQEQQGKQVQVQGKQVQGQGKKVQGQGMQVQGQVQVKQGKNENAGQQNANKDMKQLQEGKQKRKKFKKIKKIFRSILQRFRWNYINDIMQLIFLYLFLFSVAQLLDFPGNTPYSKLSSSLAILTCILLIATAVIGVVLLYSKIDYFIQNKNLPSLKCFITGIKRTSLFGLWLRISSYFRKILVSLYNQTVLVIVFLMKKPDYVISWLMIVSLIFMVLLIYFQPYKWKIQNAFYIFSQISMIIMTGIIASIVLMYKSWNSQEKIFAGWIAIAFSIIVTIILVIYNIFMLVLEAILFISGRNFIEEWIKNNQEDQKSIDPLSQKSSRYMSETESANQIKLSNEQLGSEENMIKNRRGSKKNRLQSIFSSQSQNDYNPVLKKGDAPQILMKLPKHTSNLQQMEQPEQK